MTSSSPIDRLRAVIAAEGPPLADGLVSAQAGEVFGPLAAAGSRTTAAAGDYALLVEAIFEGYLLHYASGRLLAPADDDLRLLGGDFLYAYGLASLARLGDDDAIHDLAELIGLCAQASRDRVERQPEFGAAFWALTCLSVAAGRWPGYEQAIAAARQGDPDATITAREAAAERAQAVGLTLGLEHSLIAFRSIAAG